MMEGEFVPLAYSTQLSTLHVAFSLSCAALHKCCDTHHLLINILLHEGVSLTTIVESHGVHFMLTVPNIGS